MPIVRTSTRTAPNAGCVTSSSTRSREPAMLLSELRGARVVGTDDEELGHAHDVGRRSFGAQLGYVQGTVQGPWLLRRLLRRRPQLVPWQAVVRRDADRIVVDLALVPEQQV